MEIRCNDPEIARRSLRIRSFNLVITAWRHVTYLGSPPATELIMSHKRQAHTYVFNHLCNAVLFPAVICDHTYDSFN